MKKIITIFILINSYISYTLNMEQNQSYKSYKLQELDTEAVIIETQEYRLSIINMVKNAYEYLILNTDNFDKFLEEINTKDKKLRHKPEIKSFFEQMVVSRKNKLLSYTSLVEDKIKNCINNQEYSNAKKIIKKFLINFNCDSLLDNYWDKQTKKLINLQELKLALSKLKNNLDNIITSAENKALIAFIAITTALLFIVSGPILVAALPLLAFAIYKKTEEKLLPIFSIISAISVNLEHTKAKIAALQNN